MTDIETAQTQKASPETLVLRGQPKPVTRFRRHIVIGAAAVVTISIAGAAWLALRAPGIKISTQGDELFNTGTKPPPDQLAALPSSYDKVKTPVLGPPLPGDLGTSIVNREKSLGITPALGAVGPKGEEDAARAEQLRQAQLAQQAREAKVLFPTGGENQTSNAAPTSSPSSVREPTSAPSQVPAQSNDPAGQQHKLDFMHQRDDAVYNSHQLETPESAYELLAGTIIPASLITGLNSDLPGLVIAQVSQNLYDSVSGTVLLLPIGSRLIGKYDSVIAFGQSRALVVWQRIVMPNGASIEIDNLPATDTEGYAGLEDEVDYHTWRLLKGVALSTFLGIGTQLSVNNENNDLLSALRDSAQNSANQAGQQLTQKNMDIQPTITVRPGWPLRVIVSRDIILRPYQG